uniref:Centrosome-associated zinc finger protein CP190 n=1 Tax=Cacopsylla melanoneura TaxID=428564 RepID=A0A8D9A955_9HEMI
MDTMKGKPDSFTMKKIKVENWSSFLLQKLYHCYTKQKYCDFTLKMVDGNLKVHSVVMNACSNYFILINLENSSTLTLPPQLRKELMEPIVNFIYSGVLSFKTNIQKDLVEASKILKIDILTKLIDTEDIINDSKSSTSKTIPFEDAHIKQRHFLSSGDSPAPAPAPSSSSTCLPGASVIKSTPSSASSGGKLMSTKKLPFWKKRSTTPGACSSFSSSSSGSRHDEEEDIKPSRFELPDDSCSNSAYFYVPNFENPLSYESESIVRPDEKILKRVTKSAESVSESKKIKLIKSAVVDTQRAGEEEECHSDNEILPDDDYEDYDHQFPSTSSGTVNTPPKPILKTDKFDSVRKKSVRFSVGESTGAPNLSQREELLPNQELTEEKVITRKIVTIKEEPDEESPLESSTDLQHSSTTPLTPPLHSRQAASQSLGGGANSIHLSLNNPHELANIDPNHAKIIEEVLQKYPDLVRGNRNFKLKVVNSDNQIINYIMNNKNKCLVNMGGKKKSTTRPGEPVKNGSVVKSHMPGGGLESQAPPSFDCKYCGPNLSEPLPDYRTWRTHMQDVHGEKFDVRVCEYCGLKLSKRNLYLYHLLRVHGIRSDSMRFPECSYCSYIALTENLLYKHCKNVHNKLIGFVCSTCNTMFKTNDQLMLHIQLTEHGSEKKFHACKHCGKQFDRSVNLKAHLRANHNQEQDNSHANATPGGETGDSVHHQVVIKQEVVDQQTPQTAVQIVTPPDGSEYDAYMRQQYIEVPVMQSNAYGTLVLPGGVTIVDTNNSRLSQCDPEPSEQMINSETSLGVAPTTMEPNEAVLGKENNDKPDIKQSTR